MLICTVDDHLIDEEEINDRVENLSIKGVFWPECLMYSESMSGHMFMQKEFGNNKGEEKYQEAVDYLKKLFPDDIVTWNDGSDGDD